MKSIFLGLVLISSLLGACDRQTLDGLNLKMKAEFNSDYESSSEVENEESKPMTNDNSPFPSETLKNQPIKEVNVESESKSASKPKLEPESDQPIAFKPLQDCSPSGITAKTNEIFYSQNSQVKSVDSKNEQQMKQWKKIYAEVEAKCK
jgi:hypothetical protein